MEARVNQLQALVVRMSQKMGMMGDILRAQNDAFNMHQALLLEVERKQAIERRLDPRGWTFANLILIESDEEVTLVDELGVVH